MIVSVVVRKAGVATRHGRGGQACIVAYLRLGLSSLRASTPTIVVDAIYLPKGDITDVPCLSVDSLAENLVMVFRIFRIVTMIL